MIISTTPEDITLKIKNFCKTLSSSEPKYINVVPDSKAKEGYCFQNVTMKCNSEGGKCVNGWTVWQCGNMYLEAEAHAVWESIDGELRDITPKTDGEKRILFISDPSLQIEDYQISNRYYALSESQFVKQIIWMSQRIDDINSNRKIGLSEMSMADVVEVQNLKEKRKDLFAEMIKPVGRNKKCSCGSGKKYKFCCMPFDK